MITYDVSWVGGTEILPEHKKLSVRQVYVWVQSDPDKVVVVSKDGKEWQLPGGKPEDDETALQTATREVYEETGVDIRDNEDALQFFGYRVVTEKDGDDIITSYLQLRYHILVCFDSGSLSVMQEDTLQPTDDVIQFVESVTLDEACQRIAWLRDSDEFHALRAL